jgi:hypothetical protein
MENHMSLPNFLIVGAMKSGTTTLKKHLQSHDEAFLVPREIHFFDNDDNYNRGIEWYKEHFKDASGYAAVGEKTPAYCYASSAPERIHKHLPNAKLIWIFREPVSRAYSHYWWTVRMGSQRLTFTSAVKTAMKEERVQRISHRVHLLNRGKYSDQIKRYLNFFPREQMLFLLLDDLIREPQSTMRRVFEFLEINPNIEVEQGLRKNYAKNSPVYYPRSIFLNWMSNRLFKESSVPYQMVDRLNRGVTSGYPPLKEDTKALLTKYYEPYNAQLSELIGCDLGTWGQK